MTSRFTRRLSKSRNGIFRNVVYELDRRSRRQINPTINAAWTWINDSNYWSAAPFGPHIVAKFRQMLGEGQIGLFGLLEWRPIAYCWAIVGQTPTPLPVNDVVSLKKGQAYIHFCHTHDQYRGNGIYPWLLSLMTEHLFEDCRVGVTFIDTAFENVSSHRGILKVGFRPIRMVTRLMFLGKQLALPREIYSEQCQ